MFGKYGAEAKQARALLREGTPQPISRIWQKNRGHAGGSTFVVSETGGRFYNAIEALKTATHEQRSLKSRLGQITADLARTRLLVFTQSDNAITVPFFMLLQFWLMVVFASLCLFAESTAIAVATVVVFALSVS